MGGYCQSCTKRVGSKFCPDCGVVVAPLPTCPSCQHPDHGCVCCQVSFPPYDLDDVCNCIGVIRPGETQKRPI
jgi:hypothetical protein